ncbi:MAG: SOS response-associated peptidase [Pontiellaceae bacterium]|nr:SOS response-associated peptidase [Pontiellaceae bacterium]
MCGRFTQTKTREEILQQLVEIELPPLFQNRYNVAPMQKVATIRNLDTKNAEESIWGFLNPRSSSPVINARSETVYERPMFRNLLTNGRCLIPADGFYEWKGRQPYYFQLPEKELFAFGGLWKNDRCVIITRAADNTMQGIHDRMPFMLRIGQWTSWLSSPSPDRFLHEFQPPEMTCHPVSRRVNAVRNDDPACLSDAEIQEELF